MPKYKSYDDYISSMEEFAQPILKHLRSCVNEACPDVVEEFKWSFPNFTYKGSILCHMAGFKKHVAFGFWLGAQMEDPENIMIKEVNTGMGQLGKISSIEELPPKDVLVKYIREAMRLTDAGVKAPSAGKKKAKEVEVPKLLVDELNKNQRAFQTFNNFSQSNRNEYSEWITDAKTEKTALKRLEQTIEWLEEGKSRNWKYMKG